MFGRIVVAQGQSAHILTEIQLTIRIQIFQRTQLHHVRCIR